MDREHYIHMRDLLIHRAARLADRVAPHPERGALEPEVVAWRGLWNSTYHREMARLAKRAGLQAWDYDDRGD